MKPSDLDILLREGEGTLLEYKEDLSASFARELVAFANTLGGRILLGVRDDGSVRGVTDSNALRARIQDLARNCDPPVILRVERQGPVVVVTVREADVKPVQCSDGFFWRQGAVTQKLSRDEIRDLFRREGSVRFDVAPCPRFRYPRDFDSARFREWLKRTAISPTAAPEDVLVNLDVAERSPGRLLFRNAGVLFFAREVRRFFNQAYVTCLLFKGKDRVHILDRKDFAGGVTADIEEALRFVERNTRTAYRIRGLQREEIPEYPMAALREAITNAVLHRDWFNDGANVFIEVYADRIEIVSPGGLPAGMRYADLGRKSVRRNPLVADLLHRIAFIEKAGTGIQRMREAARLQGHPQPELRADGFFTVVFRPLAETPPKPPSSTPQAPPRLAPQALKLLSAARTPATRDALMATLGLSDRKHFRVRHLQPLLAAGWLEPTEPDRPRSPLQRYQTTASGLQALNSGEGVQPR